MLLPVGLLLFGDMLWRKSQGKPSFASKIPEWAWIALIIILLIYGVLRNLPAFSFLAPMEIPSS